MSLRCPLLWLLLLLLLLLQELRLQLGLLKKVVVLDRALKLVRSPINSYWRRANGRVDLRSHCWLLDLLRDMCRCSRLWCRTCRSRIGWKVEWHFLHVLAQSIDISDSPNTRLRAADTSCPPSCLAGSTISEVYRSPGRRT